ncbi:MAG: multi-sensor hybrid histidine kinase [Fibrobacteres bacterium]|nr:multi-sensor hybrid histidine kinase [Fibrobacterota bacterium]
MADVLRMNGYHAVTAKHGVEALEICDRDGLPDLLVTDVMMPPYFDGVELVRRLRARNPDLKALYVSAYAGDPRLAEVFQDDLSDFLPKPLGPIVLLQRVESMLDGTRGALERDSFRQRGTILLCVADVHRRQWVRECLTGSGFWVLDAAHPAEAQFLGRWHEGVIHLLLSDPPKPGQDGQWHRYFSEHRPAMDVLFVEECQESVSLIPDAPRDTIPELWENVRQSLVRALV